MIFVAFFPVILLLTFLALSFNITRRTMVKRTQESAVFSVASNAGRRSRGIRSWIARLDYLTLQKIREITLRQRQLRERYQRVDPATGSDDPAG